MRLQAPLGRLITVAPILAGHAAWAQEPVPQQQPFANGLFGQGIFSLGAENPWRAFAEGWAGFLDAPFLIQEFLSLVVAVALASAIAFHPRARRSAMTASAWDRPKAMVTYALVGAVVAELVLFNPPMAFVVFGIGGLMRFRSVVGEARETGRAILCAVVGLACGLKLFPLAVLATGFYWIGPWLLQSRTPVLVEVRKLTPECTDEALDAWRRALEERSCRVGNQRILADRGRFDLLVLVPVQTDPDELIASLDLPENLQGTATWNED